MVEKNATLIDRVHLQKYIYLLNLFCSQEIEPVDFEKTFLQIRREDNYWMSGSFNESIDRVLNSFFLDLDEYNPDNLFDKNDVFNINEKELRKRANDTLQKLLILSN